MSALFFSYPWIRLRRYFVKKPAAKIITIGMFALIALAIALAIYFAVHAGFLLMQQQAYGQQTLPFYTYEIFFLVIGFLMFASAVVSSLFALFRHEDEWIAATPKFNALLLNAVTRIFSASLWPLLLIGVPAILALNNVYSGGFTYITAAFAGLVLLSAIACGLATALTLLITEIFYYMGVSGRKALHMKWIVSVALVAVAAVAGFIWSRIASMDILQLFVSGQADASSASVAGIAAAFQVFPTHLMAFIMLQLQNGDWMHAWINIAWLLATALALGGIIYLLSFGYLVAWQRLQEGRFEARLAIGPPSGKPSFFPRFVKTVTGAIFEKEIIVNFRNPKDAAWLFFMLALWIIQTTLNLFLRRNIGQHGLSTDTIAAAIQSLQLITAVFFVSAFVLRFVLPSFSSERRTAWILGTAPISPRRIFLLKLMFYSVLFLTLGVAFGVINSAVLGISLTGAGEFLGMLAVMIAGITAFGLALGTLWPNTESDDAETISTSLIGLAFTFISLLASGLGALLYYRLLTFSEVLPAGIFIAALLALTAGIIAVTLQKLKTFNPFTAETLQ